MAGPGPIPWTALKEIVADTGHGDPELMMEVLQGLDAIYLRWSHKKTSDAD